MANLQSCVEALYDRNKSSPDEILRLFKNLMGNFGYSAPKSTGKTPQKIYNKIKDNINISNGDDMFTLVLTNLEFTQPDESYIDIVVTMVELVQMYRHDLFSSILSRKLADVGFCIVDEDFRLSKHFSIDSKLTPDLLIEKDGVKHIVEIKMRDPNFLDKKMFYEKYNIVENVKVTICNYYSGRLDSYGDLDIEELVELDTNEVDTLNYLIKVTTDIKNKYSVFELFRQIMVKTEIVDDGPFVTGYKDLFFNHESINEIKGIYSSYFDDLIKAVDSFNFKSQSTIDILQGSRQLLYKHCGEKLNYDIIQTYAKMVEGGDYDPYPKCDSGLSVRVDNKIKDRYTITSKYSPSLYVLFNDCIEIKLPRVVYYKKVFSSKFEPIVESEYTEAAMNMLKNIMMDDDLESLLGLTELQPKGVATRDPTRTVTFEKTKLLMKKSMELYDINMYINNTFSYNDHKVKNSKEKICGYTRKNYGSGVGKTKESLLLADKSQDIDIVQGIINEIDGFYSDESMITDLKYYREDFEDVVHINKSYMDQFAYYSYNSSNMFKSLIALSTISSKKYRLLQFGDPNTICVVLPNADVYHNNPIRYFTVCITKNEKIIDLNKLMGLYAGHYSSENYNIIISKVISLDLNRCKLLSNSFAKYMILRSYYDGFIDFHEKKKIINFNNILLTNMITMNSLSLTENYKNLMLVAYSDYGNLNKLVDDKFEPRLKNYTSIWLTSKMIDSLFMADNQRRMILKMQCEVGLTVDGFDLKDTGFRMSDDLLMPITNVHTRDPREILQEAYLIYYLGNKNLHGSPQEMIQLYTVPMEFEIEYTNYLNQYGSLLQEVTGDKSYGFSYETMKLSTIYAYSKQFSDIQKTRQKIIADLDLDSSILSKPQFTSTKSMVTDEISTTTTEIKLSPDVSPITFGKWLKTVKIDDPKDFCERTNNMIREYNVFRRSNSDKLDPLPFLSVDYKSGSPIITCKPYSYVRFFMNDMISCNGNKVFDEMLKYTKDMDTPTLRSIMINNSTSGKNVNNFRIFNKDQRTFTDREIYTGNKYARFCLYPIEKLFLTINTKIDEEAITIPGDIKHKKMYDQRHQLVRETKYKYDKRVHKKTLLSVSSDASKWSARDAYVKFFISVAYNPFLLPEEKWFYLYCLLSYYKKNIILTDSVLKNLYSLNKENVIGKFELLTSNYTKNYFQVRSNWLQGNLNRLSSFVHYCSALTVNVMLDYYNDCYQDRNIMRFMVHSDDSTYDFSMILNKDNDNNIGMRSDYGRFIISMIKVVERHHSIILNEKKTYLSTFYKEFLSTLLVGNVLSYFYIADLLPLTSDLSYKSPLDDIASLSSFIQNAYAHAAPYRVVQTAINVMNYVSLSTYNLNNNSKKSPSVFQTSLNNKYSMVPVSIMPTYRYGAEHGGLIPYYASDAFHILNKLLVVSETNLTSEPADVIDLDLITKCIPMLSKEYQNYIKLCLLSFDNTIFNDEDEDPYNTSKKDLSISPIVSVKPTVAKFKGSKYESYNEFKSNENSIIKLYACHPEWLLCRPDNNEDCRTSLLSNYLVPNFIDSLQYSNPSLEYGKRIIDSNKAIYRLNIKGVSDNQSYNAFNLYSRLDNCINGVNIDPAKLLAYIHTFLFSDKDTAYAIYIWNNKKVKRIQPKTDLNMKVIMPASLFKRERGALSVTTIIKQILLESSEIPDTIDLKYDSLINYCYNLLSCLNLTNIKIYNSHLDIDESFKTYSNTISSHRNDYETLITEMNVHPDNEIRTKIIDIRQRFKSLIIRYLNDVIKSRSEPLFIFEDYPSPQSVLSTIDKYAKKDMISSKVYMSCKRSNRKDDYWLSRLGMYDSEFTYTEYKLNTKYTYDKSDNLVVLDTNNKQVEQFVQYVGLVAKQDMISTLKMSTFNGKTYDDMVRKLHASDNFNHKLVLHKLGEISIFNLKMSLSKTRRRMNYWIVPHNSTEDANQSSCVYLYEGVFMKVITLSVGSAISINVTFYHNRDNISNQIVSLVNQFAKDYRSHLMNKIIYSVQHTDNKIYRDDYWNFTINPRIHNVNQNFEVFSYNMRRYDNIAVNNITITENNRYVFETSILNRNIKMFDFNFRDSLYHSRSDMVDLILENIHKHKRLDNIIIQNRLINDDNCNEILSMTDNDFIERLSYNLELFPIKMFTKSEINKYDSYKRSVLISFIKNHKEDIDTLISSNFPNEGRWVKKYIHRFLPLEEGTFSDDVSALKYLESVNINRNYQEKLHRGYYYPYSDIYFEVIKSNNPVELKITMLEMLTISMLKIAVISSELHDRIMETDEDYY
nr:RNA-dependent RNA polymerase [Callicarpa mosaic-associated virus 2]